jgi:hypothetical protein
MINIDYQDSFLLTIVFRYAIMILINVGMMDTVVASDKISDELILKGAIIHGSNLWLRSCFLTGTERIQTAYRYGGFWGNGKQHIPRQAIREGFPASIIS